MQKFKQYGVIGIITHLSLSWTFLFATYIIIKKGKSSQKIIKYLKLENKIPANAGPFIISGLIYKAVMPARLALSAVTIPLVFTIFNLQKPQKPIQTQQKEQKQKKNLLDIINQSNINTDLKL